MDLFGLFRKRPRSRGRTEIINHLIAARGYTRYLEIGVRDPRDNFDHIQAVYKHAVDPAPKRPISHPMTSDAFFARALNGAGEGTAPQYDLVFIDELHLAEQVERDVVNALACLASGGAIVLHDCNPQSEEAQTEHYDGKKTWNGTVWKAWARLRATRTDLTMFVVDTDHGCGFIERGHQEPITLASTDTAALTYSVLEQDRARILNLVSMDAFKAYVAATSVVRPA